MIVEFAGLPGSGKTYLRDALANHLSQRGVPVTARHVLRDGRRAAMLAHRGVSALLKPGVTIAMLQALHAARRPIPERAFALRLGLVTLDNARWATHRNGVFLVDEGFVQRAFLLFGGEASAPSERVLRHYLHRVPLPDLLVLLELPPALVGARLAGRERQLPARFRRLDAAGKQRALEDGARLLERIALLAKDDPRAPRVIRIPVEGGTAGPEEDWLTVLECEIAQRSKGKWPICGDVRRTAWFVDQ